MDDQQLMKLARNAAALASLLMDERGDELVRVEIVCTSRAASATRETSHVAASMEVAACDGDEGNCRVKADFGEVSLPEMAIAHVLSCVAAHTLHGPFNALVDLTSESVAADHEEEQ